METKYEINEIVYRVHEFRVIKSVISEIIMKKDNNGTQVTYVIYPYQQMDTERKKYQQCCEAELVKNLKTAKESALINWKQITKKVENSLINLTDKDFEPMKVITKK